MTDNLQDAATLRARLEHHTATKAAAEAERARIIADRSEVGGLLSDDELDQIDQEVARLADVIERAGSRVELLRPALAAAEAREADDERRRRTAGGSEQDAGIVKAVADNFGTNAAAEVAVALRAAAIPVRPVNPRLFDEQRPPIQTSVDLEAWHRDRDARLRAERAARTSL